MRIESIITKAISNIKSLSLDAAREANGKAVKGLTDALAILKLNNMQISTAPLSIVQQDAVRVGPAGRVLGGGGGNVPMPGIDPYVITNSQTITLTERDPEKLRESLDKISKVLVESGANTSGNAPVFDDGPYPARGTDNGPKIVLTREDDSEFRERACAEAVKKALRSAKVLAEGAGLKIVETNSITVGEEFEYRPRAASKEVAAGELHVTVRVNVTCSY